MERDMTKGEFAMQIQKSLRNIFEGCHKDELKNTLSLRAILYEVRIKQLISKLERIKYLRACSRLYGRFLHAIRFLSHLR